MIMKSLSQHLLVVGLCVVVAVYLIPSPIDPKPYFFADPPQMTGPLKVNRRLQKADRLFKGRVFGPESLAVDKEGVFYTGGLDGKIWRFHDHSLELLARTGSNYSECGSPELEPECGRPKGVAIDNKGSLYVADAYKGLLQVNTTTGEVNILLPSEKGLDGIPFKFLNGMTISKSGVLYFTDSSSKWDRRSHKYEIIENNALGRLIEYDPASGEARVLLSGLHMANGVSLSPHEDFLLVSELNICRITRYFLRGPKAGTSEIFTDNLPGYPDNIKATSAGTYFIGLAASRIQKSRFMRPFLDVIAPYPAIKRFITKITPLSVYALFIPKHVLFIEVDQQGNIVDSFHDPDGAVISACSEAFEHDGKVYLGHFGTDYIGVIGMADLKSNVT
ncbi:unnamed protein product [Owenia fusiformis]|uniref:Strictosidine synthase conserved region domain-containing protein n=1 Tax=Owenia fusiformis TaxID=6347 RepID=A0A8S4NQC4_OWEFU|nr:unnamed protein product [Owenia fusiformis]